MSEDSSSNLSSVDWIADGKHLWDRILRSGYLDSDTYERSIDQITPNLDDIRSYLKSEHVTHEDRPNTARTLALLLISLPAAGEEEIRKSLSLAFLKLGLSLGVMPGDDSQQYTGRCFFHFLVRFVSCTRSGSHWVCAARPRWAALTMEGAPTPRHSRKATPVMGDVGAETT
jgi:hypothetical protein